MVLAGYFCYSASFERRIYLFINSPGGSITAGFAIYDTINALNLMFKTICIGMADKSGSFLLAAGAKKVNVSRYQMQK